MYDRIDLVCGVANGLGGEYPSMSQNLNVFLEVPIFTDQMLSAFNSGSLQ